jgi:glycosyltransferase involved in cell wall biosynthesis
MARELGLGGTERQLAETALSLDRARFAPHVACFRPGGFREAELRQAGVPVVELGVRSLVSASALIGARRLGRYLALHDIRLVHTFDVPLDLFGVPVSRLFRAPVVLSSQRAHRALTPGATRHFLRLTDRIADGIVVNCRSVARELVSRDGVPASRIHLAYNGIDTAVFCPEGAMAEAPWGHAAKNAAKNAPENAPGPWPPVPGPPAPGPPESLTVIGVVCALRPEKGLPLLLEAFAQVRGSHPEARLLVVGSGPMQAELEACARQHKLGGDCRFHSAAQNVAEWLRVIDIFVLPSRSEALSNSLMEAMACGCCAIASDAGGNPELVRDGETGLLFPTGDSTALAARLERLLSDRDTRRRLAANGAQFMRQRFNREAAARRMGEIYLSFLEPTT